jgi:hypothetical protein
MQGDGRNTCAHCGKGLNFSWGSGPAVVPAGRESGAAPVWCCGAECAEKYAESLNSPEYVVTCPCCTCRIAVN